MSASISGIRDFFRRHRAAAVGTYPIPDEQMADVDTPADLVELDIEVASNTWQPMILSEKPARSEETPKRFIDGSHVGHAVLSMRDPEFGCVVPLMLAEVGGVAMNTKGRGLVRDFFGLERVISFVADLFAWEQVEAVAAEFAALPGFSLRLLPANRPGGGNLFDYEQMRKQAQNRTNQEMAEWEAVALASDTDRPVLVDGRLEPRIRQKDAERRSLVVGVVKQHAVRYLHDKGMKTLFDLRAGQRTPVFKIARRKEQDRTDPEGKLIPGKVIDLPLPVASWYLRLSTGLNSGPDYGYVRIEIPWVQFARWDSDQKGFVDRLSRWLVDARCRQASYARMAISLEPVVRAEDSLKALFTPFTVLRNRFFLTAGVREEDGA
jgi:hypothetical protein